MGDRRSVNDARDRDGLRVLVVDDNHDNADTLGKLVSLWGHESKVAYDALTALKTASSFQPHVVLSDIGMPGMDGYDLARQLRQRTDLPCPALIAISGYADEVHRQKSLEAGFESYLVKPANPQELRELLASIRDRLKAPAEENGLLRRLQERLTRTAHLLQPANDA
jgi:CheY-like chemotaxis protein